MILTIYFVVISVLLCIIEFFLVKKGKTDLAICIPIFVLIQSFSSGYNLALLSLILLFLVQSRHFEFLAQLVMMTT